MFGLNNVNTDECGELNTTKIKDNHAHIHFPFYKNQIDIFNKHHKSYNRPANGVPPEFKRLNQRYNTSTTAELMKTMHFNPTMGSEKMGFYETDTNMHLLYPKSKPRFSSVNNRDTSIPDKIDAWKKPGRHYHAYPQQSHSLKIRRI